MNITVNAQNKAAHATYLQIQQIIHEFLQQKGYAHIEVPMLSPVLIPESYLEVFETEFRYFDEKEKLYLIPSPELFLKRLMAQGIGSCYSLMKVFRNSEPGTSRHSPEFTMLEFYKVNGDYMEIAEDTLAMMQAIAQKLYGKTTIMFQEKEISLSSWEKITVSEAFEQYAQIKNVLDKEALFTQAKQKGYTVDGFSYADVWSQIYTQEVEPHLGANGKPTIIYEYPLELAATAQFNQEKNVAERLEFYIEGVELGNCGNAARDGVDWNEFTNRFNQEIITRKELGKIDHPADMEFIPTLQQMPPCAGIAIGVERLAMIFANVKSIADLQLISIQ